MNREITQSMKDLIYTIKNKYTEKKIALMFENGIKNTYETTITPQKNGTTFVITGDIPAMWLRDSVAQVRPLLILAKDDEFIFDLIKGVVELHKRQILIDPYANAFNKEANGEGYQDDLTEMRKEVWERKYEIDSLCYPIQLAYLLWKSTDRTDFFDELFVEVVETIINLWRTEQHHMEQSPYHFQRIADWLLFEQKDRIIYETLGNKGKGWEVGYTGMTWCGFRPSDDACQLGYHIPSNMFAVVVLSYVEEIFTQVYKNNDIVRKASALKSEIDQGIKKYGIIDHKEFGKVYAYEVDGLGKYNLMDDANVPSLLSAPYLGYCDINDEIYQNTRKMLLSKANPFYFEGKVAKGIGSPHTPENYIWHISLAIQGMTTTSETEKQEILDMFIKTDADTNLMHEGFHVDDPKRYTRPWFSWANSMFAEFILSLNSIFVKGSPLEKLYQSNRR